MSLGIQNTEALPSVVCQAHAPNLLGRQRLRLRGQVRQRVLRQATVSPQPLIFVRASQRCGKIADDVAARNVAVREQDWTTLSALLQAAAEQAEKDLSMQGDNGASSNRLEACRPRAPPDLGQHPPATPRAREEAVRSYRLAVTSRQHT